MQPFSFNVANVDTNFSSVEATLVPDDWYVAMIKEISDFITNGKNTGQYVEFTIEIVDGEYKGKTIIPRLNLKHIKEITVQIAYKELSAMAHAVGVTEGNDLSVLKDKPMRIKTRTEESEGFKPRSTICEYQPMSAQVQSTAPAQTTTAPTPPPTDTATQAAQQPWEQASKQPWETTSAPAQVVGNTELPPWEKK